MKRSREIFIFCLIIVAFAACKPTKKVIPDAGELIQADRDFSLSSVKNGMKKAFIQYADTAAVLLPNNNYPLEGKTMMINHMKNIADSLFCLKWEPLKASIAAAGDLGFTYGVYERIPSDTLNGHKTEKGTYITIWKKQEDGNWKFVFDAGNEGLGK